MMLKLLGSIFRSDRCPYLTAGVSAPSEPHHLAPTIASGSEVDPPAVNGAYWLSLGHRAWEVHCTWCLPQLVQDVCYMWQPPASLVALGQVPCAAWVLNWLEWLACVARVRSGHHVWYAKLRGHPWDWPHAIAPACGARWVWHPCLAGIKTSWAPKLLMKIPEGVYLFGT